MIFHRFSPSTVFIGAQFYKLFDGSQILDTSRKICTVLSESDLSPIIYIPADPKKQLTLDYGDKRFVFGSAEDLKYFIGKEYARAQKNTGEDSSLPDMTIHYPCSGRGYKIWDMPGLNVITDESIQKTLKAIEAADVYINRRTTRKAKENRPQRSQITLHEKRTAKSFGRVDEGRQDCPRNLIEDFYGNVYTDFAAIQRRKACDRPRQLRTNLSGGTTIAQRVALGRRRIDPGLYRTARRRRR